MTQEEASMKRLTRKIAHALAVTVFSLLEVLGIPKLDVRADRDPRP